MTTLDAELFVSLGPNPRLVRMCAAEKGIALRETWIDLRGGENRQPEYLTLNPGGQMPALRLPTGQVIAETLAICEYFEEVSPSPAMIGTTPEARAEVRMWLRRVENFFVRPMIDAYRYGPAHHLFDGRMRLLPDASDGMAALARDGLDWLEQNAQGGPYLLGDRMTLADIMLFCFMDFASRRGVLTPDADHPKLRAIFDAMEQRRSVIDTLHLTYNRPDDA